MIESPESSSCLERNTFDSISEGYVSCGSDRNKFIGHLHLFNELKKDIKYGDKYAAQQEESQSIIGDLSVSLAADHSGLVSTLNGNELS